jgi:serpin B
LTESYGYTAGNGYQAVELPYDGRELSMVIIMPDDLKAFEASLTGEQVTSIVEALEYQQVALAMPKWEYDYTLGLKDALKKLGMEQAFNPAVADFSSMDGKKDLYIQDVLHKAFISVDEAGTEAAAATAVVVGVTAIPAEPVSLTIDHPFIYLIRDIQTGAVLFVGRMVNPG